MNDRSEENGVKISHNGCSGERKGMQRIATVRLHIDKLASHAVFAPSLYGIVERIERAADECGIGYLLWSSRKVEESNGLDGKGCVRGFRRAVKAYRRRPWRGMVELGSKDGKCT